MKSILMVLTSFTYMVGCIPPPHPDVEAVRFEEELLPPNLRSPALHNPNLQEILPLTSLLHNGEKLVYNREAHNVSRKEIYNILTHAGFIPRKKFPHLQTPVKQQFPIIHEEFFQQSFYEPPRIPTQDYLQYL